MTTTYAATTRATNGLTAIHETAEHVILRGDRRSCLVMAYNLGCEHTDDKGDGDVSYMLTEGVMALPTDDGSYVLSIPRLTWLNG